MDNCMNIPLSENYTVLVNGKEAAAYHTEAADFAVVCFNGCADIEIITKKPFDSAIVRPLSKNYKAAVNGNTIRLKLTDKDRVSVEPYGLDNPLFILCSEYIKKPDNATIVFERGTFTDAGVVELASGDCVYIEEGAVVAGAFTADKARDIEITGNGVLWGLPLHERRYGPKKRKAMMIFPVDCENVRVSGITIADSPSWNIVPTACRGVSVSGVNIIGVVMSSDGIDVVGCEDAEISHCFICVNDDCLVVKAVRYGDPRGARDVRGVRASDCVLWKLKCGNAIEIGYETSCDEISGVVFEDIDVIHSQYEGWQSGGVFTIHNGDRAHVHDVAYRNIRVEDAQEKLIDIKILSSKYSSDKWRGKVSDIVFDGIYVLGEELPPSIIRGYESDLGEPNLITDIKVRNLYLNGKKITGRMQAHAITELSAGVEFI